MTRVRAGIAGRSLAQRMDRKLTWALGAWRRSARTPKRGGRSRVPAAADGQSGHTRSGCAAAGKGLGAGDAALGGSDFVTALSCCAFTLRTPAASLLDVLFMIAVTPRSGLQLRGRPPCRGG